MQQIQSFWWQISPSTFWLRPPEQTFCDIFVPTCHVGGFINVSGWKLIKGWICHTFYTFKD